MTGYRATFTSGYPIGSYAGETVEALICEPQGFGAGRVIVPARFRVSARGWQFAQAWARDAITHLESERRPRSGEAFRTSVRKGRSEL